MALQQDHLDYRQGGDTGQDNVDAIQPINDGEGATQTVFRRPAENLRGRTEVLRSMASDLLYYRDFNHLVLEGAPGHNIAWSGSTTDGEAGAITQVGDLTVRPLLTPAVSTKAAVASAALSYKVAASGYATHGLNAVSIEQRDAGAGAVLTCTITDGPTKLILVTFDSLDNSQDAASAKVVIDAAVALDPGLIGLLTVTAIGAAATAIDVMAETPLSGTADQEAHRLSSGALDTLTATSPLADGDAVAIWYPYVVEPGSPPTPGGRQESNPDRATDTIPAGSLFVTSSSPEKIPGAVPVCKVVGGELVFFDGTRIAGGSAGPIGSSPYLVIDDTNFQGAPTPQVAGGIRKPAKDAQTAFDYVDRRLGELRTYTYTCSDGTETTGADFSGANAVETALTALAGASGTIFILPGAYTVSANFQVPDNVTLLGSVRGGVRITQVGGTVFSLGNQSRVENLSIETDAPNGVTTAGDTGTLRDVTLLSGTRVTVDKEGWNIVNAHFEGDSNHPDGALIILGTRNYVTNVLVESGVTIQGSGNVVTGLTLRRGAYSGYSLSLQGEYNLVADVVVWETSTVAAGAGVLLSGLYSVVDRLKIIHNSASLPTGKIAVEVSDAEHCTFGGLHVECTTGIALRIEGTSWDDINFNNSSFISSEGTALSVPGQYGGPATWTQCVFSDAEKGSSLALVANSYILPLYFKACVFSAAGLGVTRATIYGGKFQGCSFRIRNPVDATLGVRLLKGINGTVSAPSAVSPPWALYFGSITDCEFDLLDSEVEVLPGETEPAVYSSAFVVRLQSMYANNISLVNVNSHAVALTGDTALVQISPGTVINGLTIKYTNTPPVQSGTPSPPLCVFFSQARSSELRSWVQDTAPLGGFVALVGASGSSGLRISNSIISAKHADLWGLFETTDNISVVDNVFGAASSVLEESVVLPSGTGHEYRGNSWFVNTTSRSFLSFSLGVNSDFRFVDNRVVGHTTYTSVSSAVFYFGIGLEPTRMVFSGNGIAVTSDATSGALELFDIASATTLFGAGNNFSARNASAAPMGVLGANATLDPTSSIT